MPNEKAVKEISKLTATLNVLLREKVSRFCLYVGTHASVTPEGRSAAGELRRRVLRGEFGPNLSEAHLNALPDASLEDEFTAAWAGLPQDIRSRLIRQVSLELPIMEGHHALASILDTGCFNLVITGNTDTLIEDALLQANVPRARWRVLLNGLHPPEFIRDALINPDCDFFILKLCGDVLNSGIYSTSAGEIEKSVPPMIRQIKPFLVRPMVLVGYGFLDDYIFQFLPPQTDKIYHIGTAKPPGDWNFYRLFSKQSLTNIIDEDLNFEGFCNLFSRRLSVFQNVEAYGLSVTPALVEKVAGDAEESELLVELIDTEKSKPVPKQQEGDEEPLVVIVPSVGSQNTLLTMKFDDRRQMSFDLKGKIPYEGAGVELWQTDIEQLNMIVSDLGRDIAAYYRLKDQGSRATWRRRAKLEGQRLYKDLIGAHQDLSKQFAVAQRITRHPEVLTLSFVGPRNYLGMPYELLHDDNVPLVVRYPLCRQVMGVAPRRSQDFDSFVHILKRDGEPVRVLLIGSNTGGISADAEVLELRELLESRWRAPPKIQVDICLTQEASFSEVAARLEHCPYHIVHLAGHARFDPQNVEESGLLFFEKKGQGGKVKVLNARRLAQLFNDSQTMLCYLSCCVGAMIGSGQLLRDYDYLGTMDGVVSAGVPYVLGYRWYVTDGGSRRFAKHFYERLVEAPHLPEQAALHARQQVYGDDGQDETWTSPIIVAQNVRS
jgi:hypothetical protein